MLGCIRLISQSIAYELMLTTLLSSIIASYNDLNLTNYHLFFYIFNIIFINIIFTSKTWSIIIVIYLFCFNYIFIIVASISISAELNRVPFDLPESESELVAGFITEYSSIYSSLILLTEYANIIALMLFIIILFSIIYNFNIILILLISLIRSTSNRLKFDELMTNCRIVILPIIFTYCSLLLYIINLLYIIRLNE